MNKRIAKEKTLLPSNVILEEETDALWKVRTGEFLIEITFTNLYPFHAPNIRILEPVGVLPRTGICGCVNGTICVSGFLSDWGPQWRVTDILDRVTSLFKNRELD